VASWQALVDQCAKNAGDADRDVEYALRTVVLDTDAGDGTFNGFNGKAKGTSTRIRPPGTRSSPGPR
jgi:hypothetical protein